jgi:phosphoglycolate phosphatase
MSKALIFDLDGTLLDTLPDIAAALNDALKAAGIDRHYTVKDCRAFIGNGVDPLVHRALKEDDTSENFERLKKEYLPRYHAYQGRTTKPFDGLPEVLAELKKRGVLLLVCTNKPDLLAQEILGSRYGDGFFDEIYGARDGEPAKPDPHIVLYFLGKYGLHEEDAIFVGDSLPDAETAENAHIRVCMCRWGYGAYNQGLLDRCDFVIDEPKGLLDIADKI